MHYAVHCIGFYKLRKRNVNLTADFNDFYYLLLFCYCRVDWILFVWAE